MSTIKNGNKSLPTTLQLRPKELSMALTLRRDELLWILNDRQDLMALEERLLEEITELERMIDDLR